jgi:cold shock CspA family protein
MTSFVGTNKVAEVRRESLTKTRWRKEQKMEGSVKFYNRKKGFGFVSGDDGTDYFVHVSALPEGVFLRDGDRVSFDPAEGERGAKADNVQLLQKASDMEGADAPAEEAPAEETPAEEEPSEETEEEAPEEEPSEETEEPKEE